MFKIRCVHNHDNVNVMSKDKTTEAKMLLVMDSLRTILSTSRPIHPNSIYNSCII